MRRGEFRKESSRRTSPGNRRTWDKTSHKISINTHSSTHQNFDSASEKGAESKVITKRNHLKHTSSKAQTMNVLSRQTQETKYLQDQPRWAQTKETPAMSLQRFYW
jgi:hypothetical protein